MLREKLRKILNLFKEFIITRVVGKKPAEDYPDELLHTLEEAEELLTKLAYAYKSEDRFVLEYARAVEYARIIRKNIDRMMRTDEVLTFSTCYEDALWFADAVSKMYSIDYEHKLTANKLKESLEAMKRAENKTCLPGKKFCSVVFGRSNREYCYLAGEGEFFEGEYVIVPVGCSDTEKIARIVKITDHPCHDSRGSTYRLKNLLKSAVSEDVKQPVVD